MTLLIATTNPGKLREIRAVLSNAPVTLLSLADVAAIPEPEETGATFADNARLKARYYAAHTGHVTAADDSGLVIDALGGEPGVQSARFLGSSASYPERFAEIQRRLAQQPAAPRSARFICAVAVADGERVLFEAEGVVEGTIAAEAAGTNGFGYDPIFYYPPYEATLAQVDTERKLQVAHRGHAFRQVSAWLIGRDGGRRTP